MDTLAIGIRVYRQIGKPRVVAIRYVIDDNYRVEQEHRLQSTTGGVTPAQIAEAISKIISRIVEGSVFNDASPPGTAAALQSTPREAQRAEL